MTVTINYYLLIILVANPQMAGLSWMLATLAVFLSTANGLDQNELATIVHNTLRK